MTQVIDYMKNIEALPLELQLEAAKKQIKNFAAVSKTLKSTSEKLILLAAWEAVNEFRFSTYEKIANQ